MILETILSIAAQRSTKNMETATKIVSENETGNSSILKNILIIESPYTLYFFLQHKYSALYEKLQRIFKKIFC